MKRQQIHPLDDWSIFIDIEHCQIQEYSNHLYTIYGDDEFDDDNTSVGFFGYLRSLFVNAIMWLFRNSLGKVK